MNILNWILFVLLNVCLTSGVSGFRLFTNVAIWVFFIEKFYDYGLAFLWILLIFILQLVFLPLLYEFLNKKSQIFLFLNKQKKPIFALATLFLALLADVFSFPIVFRLYQMPSDVIWLFGCNCLFTGYLGLMIWLKLRKCTLFRLRKIIKLLAKWLKNRKYLTLKNFVITFNLIFAAELVKLGFSADGDAYLFVFSFLIIPLVLVELISLLSYAKKQKAQPFQRGIIFINSLLIFLYTQLAILILFLVDLI